MEGELPIALVVHIGERTIGKLKVIRIKRYCGNVHVAVFIKIPYTNAIRAIQWVEG